MTFEEAMQKFPPMWVIYHRPRDFPQFEYVVRLWAGLVCYERGMGAATLEQARKEVEKGGGEVCLGRQPDDDPVIVEVWI